MLNKILKYFHERQTQSIIYAAILIITFSAAIIFFIWSLIFLVKLIDSVVISSDEKPTTTSVFNFVDLASLSQKLKIVLPEETVAPAPLVEPTIEILPQATSTQSISIVVEIPIEEVSLQILNGTYTKGLAKSWRDKFIDAGFSAGGGSASGGKNIVAENAKTRDYNGIEISYKPSKVSVLGKIAAVLINNGISDSNIVKKEGTDELKYDFIVVIGK